jgi:hypothetical protein
VLVVADRVLVVVTGLVDVGGSVVDWLEVVGMMVVGLRVVVAKRVVVG